jgi:hypothetical protein
MDEAGHGCCDDPWQSQQSVDTVADSVEKEVIVVGLAVLQLVTLVVDKMPGNTVVQVAQEKGQEGWTSSNQSHVALAFQVEQIHKPTTNSDWFSLVGTVLRPAGRATVIAAFETWLKLRRDGEFLSLDIWEGKVLNKGPNNHRCNDGEIVDGIADCLVAEEGRELEASQPEGHRGCSKTQDDTQKCSSLVVIVGIVRKQLVRPVVRVEVTQETSGREGISEGIKNVDSNDEEGEDFVCEAGSKTNIAGHIEECSQEEVNEEPDTDPSIEGKEGDVETL